MPEGRPDAGLVADRYRLVRSLPRGPVGEAWEARDEVLHRPVVVRLVRRKRVDDDRLIEEFRRDAVLAARLGHPNVVATYDAGVFDGSAFVVTELVADGPLADLLAERGPLDPRRAVEIAAQIADALECAHRQGVVHGRLDPTGILVGEDGRVKVAGFGITTVVPRACNDGDTPSDGLPAVVPYLAPEQAEGQAPDARSDVYGLGALLYEMLCGRPPEVARSDQAMVLTPRQVRAGIPRPLEAVVVRAMAPSPDARYRSAAELQTALLSIDLGPDDAAPMLGESTPPKGVPEVRTTFVQSERSWLVPVVVIVVAAVALGVVGALFAESPAGRRLLHPAASDTAIHQPLSIARTGAFDPDGDGHEHDDALALLTDGNPGTTWSTERYGTARLKDIKPGVGVVVELDHSERLGRLEVTSPSRGWTAEVYVGPRPESTLAAWGQPVASETVTGDTTTFDLQDRPGSAVLLWITDLGDATQVKLGELRVLS